MHPTRPPSRRLRSRPYLRRGAQLAILAFLLTACGGDPADPVTAPTVTTQDGIPLIRFPAEATEIVAPFRVAETPELRIGVMEGSEAEQFSQVVGGFRTAAGEFVVVDALGPPVRRFDSAGNVVHVTGSRGEGPGELQRPARAFPTPDGGVWVWDQADGRLIEFGTDGSVRADHRVLPDGGQTAVAGLAPARASSESEGPWPLMAVMNDDRLAELMGSGPESGTYVGDAVIVWNGSGAPNEAGSAVTLDTLDVTRGAANELIVRTSGGEISGISIGRPWFHSRVHMAPSSSGLWFTNGDRWEVAEYGPEGRVRTVQFDQPEEPAGEAFARTILEELLAGVEDPEQETRIRSVHAERDWPDVIPPIRALFSDAAGRPWLGLGEGLAEPLPGQGPSLGSATLEVSDWLILEADATGVIGRVRMPARSRPLYADDEGVLLVVVDELDVPYVEWRLFEGA